MRKTPMIVRPSLPGLLLSLAMSALGLGCAAIPDRLPSHGEQLKGKTREQILTCAGPPSEWKSRDGAVLVYYRSAWTLGRSPAAIEGAVAGSRPGCRALLMLADDRVTEVRYLSVPESAGALDHCERIFSGCGG